MEEAIHIGKKINKIRELRGLKQEALAALLGISQQSVSKIERSQFVDAPTLDKIAAVLDVTSEAIKNFNEEAAIAGQPSREANTLEKITHLYESLLKSEREKIKMLEKMVYTLEKLTDQNDSMVMESPMIVW